MLNINNNKRTLYEVASISNSQPNLLKISGSHSSVAVDSSCLCFEGTIVLQNVGSYLPTSMIYHHKRLETLLLSCWFGYFPHFQVHYESRTLHEENVSPHLTTEAATQQTLSQARKGGTKKASLFAWMTLQSIPEETIISPHILDFLEQTLEPIPSTLQQAKTPGIDTLRVLPYWEIITSQSYTYKLSN